MATATGYFSNSFTFTISGLPEAHKGLAGVIERDALAVINYLSDYVSWKGTLDFVVKFGKPDDFGAGGKGLLPSYGGIAKDGQTFAASKALTGKDANGADWDLGCYVLPNANGSLTNYEAPLYFDPNPDPNSSATMPSGTHDFFSIYLHEVIHGLGFWSAAQGNYGTSAFDKLTTQRGGQYFFTGEATRALLGKDLPLSSFGSRDHYGLDDSQDIGGSPITRGLMWQYGNYEQNRFQLGQVDLAVLKDLGFTVANQHKLAITEQPDESPAHDEVFRAGDASETFDGGSGSDRVIYSGKRADYDVDMQGEGFVLVTRTAADVDKLFSIERISFSDGAYIYDLDSPNAKASYLLYGGAFDRSPDEGGLRYWTNEWLDKGSSLHGAAQRFLASDEFVDRYGAKPTDAQFVDALYLNVLHRAGEQGGVDYWNGYLAKHEGDRADVLLRFTQSDEYAASRAADIDDGFWVISPSV